MNNKYIKSLSIATASLLINSAALCVSLNTFAQTTSLNDQVKKSEQALITAPAISDEAKSVLMAKLEKLHHFSADFNQEVLSDSGELLEQSSGKLAISKPNLANWHTLLPDELLIVSDGNDVWFYNPWIEQVSVYALSAAIAQTPILLLTSKDKSLWQQYDVIQSSDNEMNSFIIKAKDLNSQIRSLTLIFDSEKPEQLTQFSFLDATGQLSHIKLSNFNAVQVPEQSLFNFILPEGVQLDDQRVN